jgi:acetylglutamate kinase
LGRVGIPVQQTETRLLTVLLESGFVPVVASIGVTDAGDLLNINADTLAGHLAGRLKAWRLAIAGTTSGVLNEAGTTEPVLDQKAIERMVTRGTATAGMIAKLRACEQAVAAGVDDVVILDGRDISALSATAAGEIPPQATRVVRGTADLAESVARQYEPTRE